MERIKKFFQTTASKNGTYSIGITFVILVMVVVANLIIGQLPEKVRKIDVSSNRLYEISDTTKKLMKKLDQDVDVKVLADKKNTDERIKTFLSKYTGISGHISVEWIDPVLHPATLNEYNASENTIVVSCADTGKSTTISFDDILVTDMSSYYYTGTVTESEFDGDGQLTSALSYVTTESTWKIYRTSGHGESTFSATISELIDKANYTVEELNLVMEPTIPEDCDLLMMYAPANDLSEAEAKAVTDYMTTGGKVMVIWGDKGKGELPNLENILKTYGLEIADGYIADMQRNYQGNYWYIFPELSLDESLSDGISSQMVLTVNSRGMEQVDPARDTITVTPFMTTSSDGYAVTEETEKQGTFLLGATATETQDDTESRLTVIAGTSLIDAQITDSFPTLENTKLFMNAVTANFDGVENVSIEPKSLTVERNTVQHGGVFSILLIFILPLAILIGGFIVWFRRRRV